MTKKNLRNMIGYGSKGKNISWPNNAKLALQIVLIACCICFFSTDLFIF